MIKIEAKCHRNSDDKEEEQSMEKVCCENTYNYIEQDTVQLNKSKTSITQQSTLRPDHLYKTYKANHPIKQQKLALASHHTQSKQAK